MVLRKPFALLIKNFRKIHLLLAALTIYVIYKANDLLAFFNEYMQEATSYAHSNIADLLVNKLLFVDLILLILGTITILVLMVTKKKRVFFYIVNIFIGIITIAVFLFAHSMLQQLQLSDVLGLRSVKLLSDLLVIVLMLQVVSLIMFAIRATGFNIKSFNFEADLDEMKIEEKDREEFEVDLEVDTSLYKRQIKRNIRHAKYVYQENKFLIHVVIVISIVTIIGIVFLNFEVINKVYKQNKFIQIGTFRMNITDSYIVDSNYRGDKLVEENALIVVQAKVNSNALKQKVSLARLHLVANNRIYHPDTNYKAAMFDFGTMYEKQILTKDAKDYIFVFQVPKRNASKNMILEYDLNREETIKIRLKPKTMKKETLGNAQIGETLELKDYIMSGSKVTISKYDLASNFRINYQFCVKTNKCISSVEELIPSLDTNYNKALLKINGTLEVGKNVRTNKIKNLSDLIQYYGNIKYKIKDETKYMNITMTEKKPTKANEDNTYYLEVTDEILKADELKLILNVRNKQYEYTLK